MKRDQLKKLGLDDEVIDKVMDLNGKDIQKYKAENEQLTEENTAFKDQIKNRDKDLKKLQDQVKDNDDLSKQVKEWQDKYKTDTKELNDQIAKVKLNSAVDQVLTTNKVRNNKAIKALLNNDEIKFDESGKLTGLDDQIKSLRKSDPYLFDEGKTPEYTPASGDTPKETKPLNQMSLTERIELKQSDPDAYHKMLGEE